MIVDTICPQPSQNPRKEEKRKSSKSRVKKLFTTICSENEHAPKLWNNLPRSEKKSDTVTISKKKLKTILVCDYFHPLSHIVLLSNFFSYLVYIIELWLRTVSKSRILNAPTNTLLLFLFLFLY